MKWLSTIKRMDEGKLTVEKMQLDDKGFPQPTGEFETLEADSLVLALGQDVDLSLLDGVPGLEIKDGTVQVAQNMMTGHDGIFAGGDMVPSERTVTVAVGHGKKAARHIDAWLRGTTYAPAEKHELASFDKLNAWYYADAPKTVRPMIETPRRQSTFEEVQGGLDETNALYEARRCLSCGNCFECDNCYGVCPDNAVIKLGPGNRFKFNYDYCKGCWLCARMPLRRHQDGAGSDLTDELRKRKRAGLVSRPVSFVRRQLAASDCNVGQVRCSTGTSYGAEVALVDDDRLEDDFLRRRLFAQVAHRDFGADAALDEAVEVAARQ